MVVNDDDCPCLQWLLLVVCCSKCTTAFASIIISVAPHLRRLANRRGRYFMITPTPAHFFTYWVDARMLWDTPHPPLTSPILILRQLPIFAVIRWDGRNNCTPKGILAPSILFWEHNELKASLHDFCCMPLVCSCATWSMLLLVV